MGGISVFVSSHDSTGVNPVVIFNLIFSVSYLSLRTKSWESRFNAGKSRLFRRFPSGVPLGHWLCFFDTKLCHVAQLSSDFGNKGYGESTSILLSLDASPPGLSRWDDDW